MAAAAPCGVCGCGEEVLSFCKECFLCYECAKDESFQIACADHMSVSEVCFMCDTSPIHSQFIPVPALLQVFKETFAIKPSRQRSILARRSQLQRKSVKKPQKAVTSHKTRAKDDKVKLSKDGKEGGNSKKTAKAANESQPKSMDVSCGFDLDQLDLAEYYAKHPVNISKPTKIPGHREGDSPLSKYLKRGKSTRKGHKGATKQMLSDVAKSLLSWYGLKPSGEPNQTVGEVFVDVLVKSYGGEGPACDHIRGLAKAVQMGSSEADEVIGGHPRLGYFAFAVGLIDGVYYSSETSNVLFEVLQRVLSAQNTMLSALLANKKEYLPFVKVDICECAVFTLFKKSKLWNLASLEDLCKRFKIPLPWSEKNRAYFMDKVEELEQVVKSLQGVNPALKAEHSVIDLDQFLYMLIRHWCDERKRIIAQVERALDLLAKQHREAEIRRKNMIEKARLRPFGNEEKERLQHLLHNELVRQDVNVNEDAVMLKLRTFDWQGFYKRNKRHIKNRTAEHLKQNMFVFEAERLQREKIAWDFNNWEWNDAWEWGGLRAVARVDTGEAELAKPEVNERQTEIYNDNTFGVQNVPPDRQVARRSALVLPPLEPLYLSQRRVLPGCSSPLREEDEVRLLRSKSMIDLRHFGGGNQLVETLCTELIGCHRPIGSMYLKDNLFTDFQGSRILTAIQGVHQLKHFQYAGNVAGKSFVRAFAASDGLVRVRTLDLSNNRLGNRFAIMLLKSLVTMHSLVDFNLSDNQLGSHPTLASQLRTTVTTLTALRKLNLSWNRLGIKDVKPLLTSLCTCSSPSKLKSLQLEFNLFRDEGLAEVSETLMHSPTLSHINLSYNLVTDLGVRSMLPSVSKRHKTARCPKQLGLTGNHLSEECKLSVRNGNTAVVIDLD